MTDSIKQPTKRKLPILQVLLVAVIVFILILWMLGSAGSAGMPIGPKQETKGMMLALTAAYTTYISDNGSFPKNLDNQRFTKLLSGKPSQKFVYMQFKPNQVNSLGELIDAWGTPFRILYLSDSDVMILSAGPDKVFGTADDISNQ
jgi:hypothetical protein